MALSIASSPGSRSSFRPALATIINGPSGSMKLYRFLLPRTIAMALVHATKADAEADKEHFDGKTSE